MESTMWSHILEIFLIKILETCQLLQSTVSHVDIKKCTHITRREYTYSGNRGYIAREKRLFQTVQK